ncbi:MAG: hypothetical protein AAGB16_06010 [Pseudomonadota bacterium]
MIEFVCSPELFGKIPEPTRAGKAMPDWFRSLPREMGMRDAHGLPGLTAKACLPMTDIFSLGYILPLPVDLQIEGEGYGAPLQIGWAQDIGFNPVEAHHPGQIGAPNPPFGAAQPQKFVNPWRLIVPKGYSVLFTHPFNHFELPFLCFNAMVDCDQFETTVNIPFLWTGAPGRHVLPAGTPIAQVIPIKRETLLKDYQARAATTEEVTHRVQADQLKYGEISTYARDWRVKK